MPSKSKPRSDVRAKTTENAMRRRAHDTLNELMDRAESGQQYGHIGIDVHFEAGEITLVDKRIRETDRPSNI